MDFPPSDRPSSAKASGRISLCRRRAQALVLPQKRRALTRCPKRPGSPKGRWGAKSPPPVAHHLRPDHAPRIRRACGPRRVTVTLRCDGAAARCISLRVSDDREHHPINMGRRMMWPWPDKAARRQTVNARMILACLHGRGDASASTSVVSLPRDFPPSAGGDWRRGQGGNGSACRRYSHRDRAARWPPIRINRRQHPRGAGRSGAERGPVARASFRLARPTGGCQRDRPWRRGGSAG